MAAHSNACVLHSDRVPRLSQQRSFHYDKVDKEIEHHFVTFLILVHDQYCNVQLVTVRQCCLSAAYDSEGS
jgi:hypothetical protein